MGRCIYSVFFFYPDSCYQDFVEVVRIIEDTVKVKTRHELYNEDTWVTKLQVTLVDLPHCTASETFKVILVQILRELGHKEMKLYLNHNLCV